MKLVNLGVYRRLYNRLEGLPDDSPRALELHNFRKEALHDILDDQEVVEIIDWGQTDDTSSHEYVELVLNIIGTTILAPVILTGLKELGKKLAGKAIDETTSEFVKWIISKFVKNQKEQKIQDFHIRLKDGTAIRIDPPDWTSQITVTFSDGEVTSIKYQLAKE